MNIKTDKQRFRRTKEEIRLGLSIDDAKKRRLANSEPKIIDQAL